MQVITSDKQRELNRALKNEEPVELLQYADTIKRLVKNRCIFTQKEKPFMETAYVTIQRSAGGATSKVPLIAYCHDKKSTGEEMTGDEFSRFIGNGGQIIK